MCKDVPQNALSPWYLIRTSCILQTSWLGFAEHLKGLDTKIRAEGRLFELRCKTDNCSKIDYFPGNDPVTPVTNVPQIAQNWPLAPQETPVAGFGAGPCPNCHHYQLIPPSPVCLISQGNVHIVSDFSAQRSDSIVKFVKLAKVWGCGGVGRDAKVAIAGR